MTTRLKNLMPSSLEESGSESKISGAITCKCPKRSFINKNWERPWRSKAAKTSNLIKWIRSNAESAGAMRMILQTHLLWLANAKELWVWSISSAWRVGSSHKNKKNHQALKTRTWDLFTGRDSNAKFARVCIHTLSKFERPSTKSSIKLMKSLRRPVETTFFLSPCR